MKFLAVIPQLRSLIWLTLILLFAPITLPAQEILSYRLTYRVPSDPLVHITITLPQHEPHPAPLALVMPRSYPGGYHQVPYDPFLTNLHAFSTAGAELAVQREPDGPRWQIGHANESIARIEYDIDVARMEHDLLSAVDSSKVRKGYTGLLGYSVFAFIDGLEALPITLQIGAPAQWPIISTLEPQAPPPVGAVQSSLNVAAADYYRLADSEILMGPDLHVERIEGTVSLVVAAYAECDTDFAAESHLAREALDRVSAYFNAAPLAHYTVQLELLKPLPGHDYSFSQEHLDSGTFARSIDGAITTKSSQRDKDAILFGYAHHMAHSWIPKRAYGIGYMPFNWEITPVLDTVWFNEGFAQYATLDALAGPLSPERAAALRETRINRWREILRDAPPVIQRMDLLQLSREASFLYSDDFRLGKNSFARGALIAADMDAAIRSATHNSKSLRDALQHLIARTDKTHRPFTINDLPMLVAEATGTDPATLQSILTRWLAPPTP